MSRVQSAAPGPTRAALRVERVSKAFGATQALSEVSLIVRNGEIRALLGENGAGKSTLIKILTGLVTPDSGRLTTGRDSAGGVVAVHQELTLVPSLSVAENMFLGRLPRRGPWVDHTRMYDRAAAALARVQLDIDPRTATEQLGLAERQLVEIARALQTEPAVLLLDEPTSSLNANEARMLFGFVKELAANGTAVLFVSHRLDEIYSLCTSATILRDGMVVDDVLLSKTTPEQLTTMMLGQQLADELDRGLSGPGGRRDEVVLRCDGLSGDGFRGVSLTVGRGEVVGVTGLVGAGQSAFARALGGLQRTQGGSVRVLGAVVRPNSPAGAIRSGIAYVPADRAQEGLCLSLSTGMNAVLPSLRKTSRLGIVMRRLTQNRAEAVVRDVDVRPARTGLRVGDLSGGNQQKVVIGKWLETEPLVTVLDDPTRGVDVGAKATIHRAIRARAATGKSFVLVSSDLTELLAVCDRIAVFRDGAVMEVVEQDRWGHEELLDAMAGTRDDVR